MINRNTKRCTYLIHPSIPSTNGSTIIVVCCHTLIPQVFIHLSGDRNQPVIVNQWKNPNLYRCNPWFKLKQSVLLTLFLSFIVTMLQYTVEYTVYPIGWFNNMRNKPLTILLLFSMNDLIAVFGNNYVPAIKFNNNLPVTLSLHAFQ